MTPDRDTLARNTSARRCPMCGAMMRGIYCSSSTCCLGGRSPWGPDCTMTEAEARAVLGLNEATTGPTMPTDRDTLARDLLTLPALVGAPGEVVLGLILRQPIGRMRRIVEHTGRGWMLNGSDWYVSPADLHREGWRVDLDAPATISVLVAVARIARCAPFGQVSPRLTLGEPRRCAEWCWYDNTPESDEPLYGSPTEAEAAARALVEVAHVE